MTCIALGFMLAATTGLRGYLPLFAMGIAANTMHIELSDGMAWLASPTALAAFGLAAFFEFVADKVPGMDHLTDMVHTFIRPIMGMMAMSGALAHANPAIVAILAIVGGGTAFTVHSVKALIRVGLTPLTLGAGSPILSIIEDIIVVSALAHGLMPQ